MAAPTADARQTPSQPIAIRPVSMKLDASLAQPRLDTVRLSVAAAQTVMSPVNQNGSFEFDRVIKSGTVVKRTRKTKSWKPVYLVLRPNLLSIYKDKDETKLRHQITLSDITAIARQKDSKKKMEHVFGIFSPARNYHLSAPSEKEAQAWVDLIRAEARINEGDEDTSLVSPAGKKTSKGLEKLVKRDVASSSSEAEPRPSSSVSPENMHSARRPSHAPNYSGNDYGSFSDFSDTGGPVQPAFHDSVASLPRTSQASQQACNVSQQSNIGSTPDDERVIFHGWLYVLKSKGGVRQWKKVWVVLRPKALGLYKTDQEYSAHLIIPFASIIDAVDIDSVSKSKQYCMQVISEEKNYRFCAPGEDALAKWLGAFKSLIRRREADQQRALQAQNPANPQPAKPTSSAPLASALVPTQPVVAVK